MALPYTYHYKLSFSALNLKKSGSSHLQTVFCVQCNSNVSSSPFTEKHSLQRYQRDQWVYNNSHNSQKLLSLKIDDQAASCSVPSDGDSTRLNDIALQLPELRKLLEVLKHKRESRGGQVPENGPGNVFLVGTGPGDPDLLTLKAVKVIQKADLLLYDRLVSNAVLDLVGPDARLLYVGKTAGFHSRTQEEIHELLLSFAEAGANVVRLKGGDPLVFGRGGEEMDFLQQQGIQVKVIPGITAASGISAELGIPLTHRDVAISVRFLTGHSKGGTDPLFVAENAADPDSTLVVYMGLSTLPSLAQKLILHGLPPDTPAAAVERGTTPQQRTVFAELKDLVDKIKTAELVSPTLIIIGKVVALSPYWPQSSKEASRLVEA
ncbi:Siroheme synthase [Hibiscus syriacus]|uniref:uroporphyrinogen-III C-methyltransferase n=1 Tax=Hibiscus syriacus TaxID=106335 RepID=A0A6A2YN39_HIBSY|nr:siroheme synthase-like [Hibiscus syriacus]KAE8680746.1 Siroheme synthase [Hibiscus syriacus]